MFNDRKLAREKKLKAELDRIETQHQDFMRQYDLLYKSVLEWRDWTRVLLRSYEEAEYDKLYEENFEKPVREYMKCLEQMYES